MFQINWCSQCISSCIRWALQSPKRKTRKDNTFSCRGHSPLSRPLGPSESDQRLQWTHGWEGWLWGRTHILGGTFLWLPILPSSLKWWYQWKKKYIYDSLLDFCLLGCQKLSTFVFLSRLAYWRWALKYSETTSRKYGRGSVLQTQLSFSWTQSLGGWRNGAVWCCWGHRGQTMTHDHKLPGVWASGGHHYPGYVVQMCVGESFSAGKQSQEHVLIASNKLYSWNLILLPGICFRERSRAEQKHLRT